MLNRSIEKVVLKKFLELMLCTVLIFMGISMQKCLAADECVINMESGTSQYLPSKYTDCANWRIYGQGQGNGVVVRDNGTITELTLILEDLTLTGGGSDYIAIDVQTGMDVTLIIRGTVRLTSGSAPVIRVAEGASLTITRENTTEDANLFLTATGTGVALESSGDVDITEGVAITALSGAGVSSSTLTIDDGCTFTSFCTGETAFECDTLAIDDSKSILNLSLDTAVACSEVCVTAADGMTGNIYSTGTDVVQLKSFAVFCSSQTCTVDCFDGTNYTCIKQKDQDTARLVAAGGGYLDIGRASVVDRAERRPILA